MKWKFPSPVATSRVLVVYPEDNVRVVKVQVGGNALIRAIAMICAVKCLVAERPAET